MKCSEVPGISGLLILQPVTFTDDRGSFVELYNKERFAGLGIPDQFVQDNLSVSRKNVVRGLHFQSPPHAQGKLVRVVSGKAMDVVVDIRKASPSYGKVFSILLEPENSHILWIPPGFAHGFASLEDNTVFEYKCTALYNKASECGILYNDADLGIDWGVKAPVVSEKDKVLGSFADLKSPF